MTRRDGRGRFDLELLFRSRHSGRTLMSYPRIPRAAQGRGGVILEEPSRGAGSEIRTYARAHAH